jgi:hypothetical protein
MVCRSCVASLHEKCKGCTCQHRTGCELQKDGKMTPGTKPVKEVSNAKAG